MSHDSHHLQPLIEFDMAGYVDQLSKQDLSYLQIVPPSWMSKQTDYLEQINHLSHLYKYGRVVMAHVVQANKLLFSTDSHFSSPAEIVYDIHGQSSIEELSEMAQKLFELKNSIPDDPELKQYADHLASEHTRLFTRVPKKLTNKALATTTIFVWRPHLPNGVLSLGYFPILISDEYEGLATVLPARFWQNTSLYQEWLTHHDIDMSGAFAKMDKASDIWANYQDYAKPSAVDFNLSDEVRDVNTEVSEQSMHFLLQCIEVIEEDYQENVFEEEEEEVRKPRLWSKIKSVLRRH